MGEPVTHRGDCRQSDTVGDKFSCSEKADQPRCNEAGDYRADGYDYRKNPCRRKGSG